MTTYALILRPEPGDSIPPETRLKAALKRLKRSHRLVCVDVRELTATEAGEDEATPQEAGNDCENG